MDVTKLRIYAYSQSKEPAVGRPNRSWVRTTYTVSPEVEKAIAIKAAEQGIDPGTVVDVIVWNALLKPDPGGSDSRGGTTEVQGRVFAEAALSRLEDPSMVMKLVDLLYPKIAGSANMMTPVQLQQTRRLVGTWKRTRVIDQQYCEAVATCIAAIGANTGIGSSTTVLPEITSSDSNPIVPMPPSQIELESLFAEEVFRFLEKESVVRTLADNLTFDNDDDFDEYDDDASFHALQRAIKRWRNNGTIDKEHQIVIMACLGAHWIPNILKDGLVEPSWFEVD